MRIGTTLVPTLFPTAQSTGFNGCSRLAFSPARAGGAAPVELVAQDRKIAVARQVHEAGMDRAAANFNPVVRFERDADLAIDGKHQVFGVARHGHRDGLAVGHDQRARAERMGADQADDEDGALGVQDRAARRKRMPGAPGRA